GRGEVHISTAGKVVTVVLAVPARAELLAPAAGVLALHSLEVHTAVLRGHDGGRAGVFTASPKFGSLPDVTLLREQFARAVGGAVVDSFAVAPRSGRVDAAWRAKVEAAVLGAAS